MIMKRLLLLILLIQAIVANAGNATDTAFFLAPSNYYNIPLWYNDSMQISIRDSNYARNACYGGAKNIETGAGQGFYSQNDIKIKGVAIGGVYWLATQNWYRDTNVDYSLDVSVLKVINGNSVEYYGHTSLNTTIDHFSNTILITKDTVLMHTIPMYEVFFDSDIVVRDTFFCMVDALIGKQDTSFFNDKAYSQCCMIVANFYDNDSTGLAGIPHYLTLAHADLSSENIYFDEEWVIERSRLPLSRNFYFIFPILDLSDSTVVNEADAVWRNAAVWPNPARETVSVASGYGLRNIDVFDIEGRLVLSREVSGLSAEIDISALPRGAYMVRITTLVGTTTKKLIVE